MVTQSSNSEEWKTYPFDSRYEVSNKGNVRNAVNRRLRKPVKLKSGYMTLVFYKPEGHVCKYVHRMVLETWEGRCPYSFECSHIDGNRSNNDFQNLKWETKKRNAARKVEHGTDYNGERNPSSKLTWSDIRVIRRRLASFVKEISADFNVSRMTITRIFLNQSWNE